MDFLFPKKTSFIASFLTLTVFGGLIYSVWTFNSRFAEIHEHEIPILELSAISVRLSSGLSKTVGLMIYGKNPRLLTEYQISRDALNDTLNEYQKKVELAGVKTSGKFPDRKTLNRIEDKIIDLMKNGQWDVAIHFYESNDYVTDVSQFNSYFQEMAEQMSLKRDETLSRNRKIVLALVTSSIGALALIITLWVLIYSAYTKNLTAKTRAEEDLEKERLRSIQASKMSSLGEMAGGIAHEINNPLAIINGYAGQIISRIDSGKATFEGIKSQSQKIMTTVDRIAKIIIGLRTFARDAGADPFVGTSLNKIVEEVIELSNARFRHHGVILKYEKGNEVTVECRAVQISQVLLNLLNNAFDAVENLPEKWVEVNVIHQNEHAEIFVTDSGGGIPPEVASKIMEPFFTTKPVGKGTGLGLSIAAGIIKSHHGRFYVDEHCRNTRFVITLPAHQPKQQKNAA